MGRDDSYQRYLAAMCENEEISSNEQNILKGFIKWRNGIRPTSGVTKTKQAAQGIYICRVLHKNEARLDTCSINDLLKVSQDSSSGQYTKNSRQTKIVTLKALANYITRQHHSIKDLDLLTKDVKAGSVSRHRKEHLTIEEWDVVLNTPMSAKERAMVAMLYDGYHRPAEILLLKWSDLNINANGNIEYEITFKTEKSRTIVQKGTATAILEMWRQELGANIGENSPIFPDRYGNPYQTITILKQLFDRLKKKTNISKLKPSMLRNTAITHDVEAGLPTSYICLRAWGEPYNEMINVYTKPDSGKMQAEQHKKNGLDSVKLIENKHRKIEGAIDCPACHVKNPTTARYCYSCGLTLTIEAFETQKAINQMVLSRPDLIMEYLRAKAIENNQDTNRFLPPARL